MDSDDSVKWPLTWWRAQCRRCKDFVWVASTYWIVEDCWDIRLTTASKNAVLRLDRVAISSRLVRAWLKRGQEVPQVVDQLESDRGWVEQFCRCHLYQVPWREAWSWDRPQFDIAQVPLDLYLLNESKLRCRSRLESAFPFLKRNDEGQQWRPQLSDLILV